MQQYLWFWLFTCLVLESIKLEFLNSWWVTVNLIQLCACHHHRKKIGSCNNSLSTEQLISVGKCWSELLRFWYHHCSGGHSAHYFFLDEPRIPSLNLPNSKSNIHMLPASKGVSTGKLWNSELKSKEQSVSWHQTENDEQIHDEVSHLPYSMATIFYFL